MIIALQTLVFFRESLFGAIDRLLRPYYKHFSLTFNRHRSVSDDEESEDHVFAEFDDERGVVFFPPMYAQRYAAVSDCLMDERWCGKLEKVVDLGYHDMSFIKYLKEVPGINRILGVDLENIPLRCSSDLLGCDDYLLKRETPLKVMLYQGNAADPDYRLIGSDAVIAIEMIEHMLPHDLERLVHTIFGFIKPWIAVITTPNGDFNPLFKALESNGRRRLDHFFEWSREQFHDWCSNIVVRYPQYTVSCQGVGPGPPGTLHYGCCSQLALFVSKDYHKQQELDINSLALVPCAPNPTNICDIVESVESPLNLTESNMLCPPNNTESYTELVFSDKQSCVTFTLTPTFSVDSIEFHDKTAQCNLDTELGKNFLFDQEPCFNVVIPRKKVHNRVYEIEDVNSRLNCTTLQVKKFSKTTQNMLAKNRIDSLVHSRAVVDEIKHLSRMLNFNSKTKENENSNCIWQNINWGDNAPYWNQYYKIVREYSYPFEVKSEESRILDLISDEINRLIDMQLGGEVLMDVNKLEIPIDHLMTVVQHITGDTDRVKDLLEWNGYEISDDVVIYSRMVDNASCGSQNDEWRENDTLSDCDTDIHSTSVSEGSTILPDAHGRYLHRALDQKVRKLRSMLSADEDISVELDRVVCRLLKLALRTIRRRQRPLPLQWIQNKMLDLLTLTEKAIEKKKKHFDNSYLMKTICYVTDMGCTNKEELGLINIKNDHAGNEIVNRYRHILRSSDHTASDKNMCSHDNIEETLSQKSSKQLINEAISSELNFDDILRSPSLVDIEPTPKYPFKPRNIFYNGHDTTLVRTKAWVEEDLKYENYAEHSTHAISSGDTDHSINNIAHLKNKKSHRKKQSRKELKDSEFDIRQRKKSASKTFYDKYNMKNVEKGKHKSKSSKAHAIRKVINKKSSYKILIKTCSTKISSSNIVTPLEKILKIIPKSASKPIPESIIAIAPKGGLAITEIDNEVINDPQQYFSRESIDDDNIDTNIAITEESLLIDIIMDDKKETIALRRTIGTDAEYEFTLFKEETVLGSMMNVMKADDSFCNHLESDYVYSQTMFIYDINEPSTSKGLRHVGMDVQCGPDETNTLATLSATTSFTKIPNILNTGIKIENSLLNINIDRNSAEFVTSTNVCASTCQIITPREKSVGIKIKDSEMDITSEAESRTMTQDCLEHIEHNDFILSIPNSFNATDTHTLIPVSTRLEIDDLVTEMCKSKSSLQKREYSVKKLSKNISNCHIESSVSKDVTVDTEFTGKYVRPQLSYGGVHVHSYKDRQSNEDIIYQGEWQRYRPKTLVKRRAMNSVVSKHNTYKTFKYNGKDPIKDKEFQDTCKRVLGNNENVKKLSSDIPKAELKTSMNSTKFIKSGRNITKVTTKLVARAMPNQNRVSCVSKKSSKTSSCIVNYDKNNVPKTCKKSYLPLYLKRKLTAMKTLSKDLGAPKIMATPLKEKNINPFSEVYCSKEKKANDLADSLAYDFEHGDNVSYLVYRNESNSTPTRDSGPAHPIEEVREIDNFTLRSPSSQSQNSSACSSPNSIATVRACKSKIISDRRYSTSSNKSNLSNGQSECVPIKNKKYTKRAKQIKKTQEKEIANKENLPESSKRNKEPDRTTKHAFMRNKSVFRAQVTTECSPETANNNLSRPRPQTVNKSKVRIPTVPCSSRKATDSITASKPSVSKKSPPKSPLSVESENKSAKSTSKLDILSRASQPEPSSDSFEPQTNEGFTPKGHDVEPATDESIIINIVDNNLLVEWMNSTYKNVDTHTNHILCAMRQLVEEKLDFIEGKSEHADLDTKTVVLSQDKLESVSVSASASFHNGSSLNNSDNSMIKGEDEYKLADINDIQNIVNNILEDSILQKTPIVSVSDTRLSAADFDLLSFKSPTSMSKLSEYFLAESSFSHVTESHLSGCPVSGSIRNIFERQKPTLDQIPSFAPNSLAVQAFSGFSMNTEPLICDQRNQINTIDSETGSLAVEFARQTTSEELFVSGRSSASYESCLLDEDAVVPNWLFQIISQQQSVNQEEEPESLIPVQFPVQEPLFDLNDNDMEPGMGPAAGAGDGRGIHSDNSQDSSGRGSSLSSTATSSEPQSEAILIDPSAFTRHYDLMRDPISSSELFPTLQIPLESPDTSYVTANGADSSRTNDILNSSGERCETTVAAVLAASDVDADVSSIDTDN